MIELYPNKLDGAPCEKWPSDYAGTVEGWLIEHVSTYAPEKAKRISAKLNGEELPHEQWASSQMRPGDLLQFYAEPKGAELIIAAVTLAAAAQFVAGLFTPQIPKTGQGQGQGERLSDSAVKGNFAKLNAPIREVAGRCLVYPDYLLPQHRYFLNKREIWVDLMLCVGVGKFSIPSSSIRIGDTPVISLGDDVEYQIFGPGESVAGNSAAVWWHSAPEVGSTSAGTAGLDLTTTSVADPVADAQTYVFSADTVTVPSGAGEFPDSWEAGMLVRIEATKPYTVVDGGGSADIIQGDLDEIGLFPGMLVEIVGDNSGLYIVDTYTSGSPDQLTLLTEGGAPAVGLVTGSVRMCIGYRGLLYQITSASTAAIAVNRLTDTGAVDGAWPEWDSYTTATALIQIDDSTSEGGWRGPFMACPKSEVTTRIEWDLMFPQGLVKLNDEGSPRPYTVTVEMQYRDAAVAGAWTSVTKTYTDRTLDQIGFTESVDLPYAYRPEVRLRRIGAKSTSPRVSDSVQWYGLRARLNAPSSYAGVTSIAMRVRIGDRLATQAENLVNVRAHRILPARAGGVELGEQQTRNPADWVRYVAGSVGYGDESLDMAELDRLGDIWAARGDWYDDSIDDQTTVKEAISDALRVGFAEATIEQGVIRPVRDEPRTITDNSYSYSAQNMTGPLNRGFNAPAPDDIDGVDVEYYDDDSEQWEPVKCRLPGDQGIRAEKVRITGVRDRTRAWRIGMRRRRELAYRRKTFEWSTELDALNSSYLSFDTVTDDVPGYGQSALMMGYSESAGVVTIESSEPFEWAPGADHVVGIRRKDGSLSGPYPATRIDEYLLSTPALDFVPDLSWNWEPPHLYFGTSERWSYQVLVKEISPGSSDTASVQAVNYDARIYTDDDNSPPA